ncbi:MAG: four helix bundle protein [Tepidisphaeraceae bacterium]
MGEQTRSFKDLIAWQKAMDFAAEVHRLSSKLPKHEQYALADQLRRSGVSVPSNIAEGQSRGPGIDFCRFLRISLGSLQEAHTQLLLAVRFGYLKNEELEMVFGLINDVNRLCRRLLQSVTPNSKRQTPN